MECQGFIGGYPRACPPRDAPHLQRMICQSCHKNPATVHVTEILEPPEGEQAPADVPPGIQEQHLCNVCAQAAQLPHGQIHSKKSVAEIWQLLKLSAQKGRKDRGLACSRCGLTLLEFRQRGRLGCPTCYEAFRQHLGDLLERIHGATAHIGRSPGLDDEELHRLQRVNDLEQQLECAVREEDYEDAARIRDELKDIKED